jgi:hypothetical protein
LVVAAQVFPFFRAGPGNRRILEFFHRRKKLRFNKTAFLAHPKPIRDQSCQKIVKKIRIVWPSSPDVNLPARP